MSAGRESASTGERGEPRQETPAFPRLVASRWLPRRRPSARDDDRVRPPLSSAGQAAAGDLLRGGWTAWCLPEALDAVKSCLPTHEPLAQSVEHLPFKQRVAGSIPARLINVVGKLRTATFLLQVASGKVFGEGSAVSAQVPGSFCSGVSAHPSSRSRRASATARSLDRLDRLRVLPSTVTVTCHTPLRSHREPSFGRPGRRGASGLFVVSGFASVRG